MSGNIIGSTGCPQCIKRGRDKTRNHLMLFQDGGAYCNRCGYKEAAETFTTPSTPPERLDAVGVAAAIKRIEDNSEIMAVPHRKLKLHVCEKYGYRTKVSTADGVTPVSYQIPIRNLETGEITGYKVKTPSKEMWIEGSTKECELFGLSVVPNRGNKLFITEGQEDAMALYQVIYEHVEDKHKRRTAVVSLQNGASSAAKELAFNLDRLSGYKEIVLCFDMDDAGRDAVAAALSVLPRDKVRVARYQLKDANDMLVAGLDKELYFDCIQAGPPKPDKIISGDEITLEDINRPLRAGLTTPFPGLDAKMRGFRYGQGAGELTVVCAGSGFGKTTLARQLDHHFIKEHKLTIGHIFLEESQIKTAQGLIALDNHIPLGDFRRDPTLIPQDKIAKSHAELIANGRTHFLKHWGSLDSLVLMDHMSYLSKVCKCDFIFLDHISLVVSGSTSSSEGERKDLDILMTRLAAFVEESGTSVIAVVHLKRPDQGSFNEGKKVSLTALRGSAAIEQLSHNVLALEGDQSSESPNDRALRVLKCREFGEVGICEHVTYNGATGHYQVNFGRVGGLSDVN